MGYTERFVPDSSAYRVRRWVISVLVAAGITWSAIQGDRTILYALGAIVACIGLALGLTYYVLSQRQRAASMKTCPECAEQVKVKAIVCRYCRYRFHVDTEAG